MSFAAIWRKQIAEVTFPVPWGHIAAKWWGPRDVRPIVSTHGWQDNAGTFDTLIPLLPRHLSYLVIDWPGHGLSSHFPAGMTYTSMDFVITLELIRRQFAWERLSLMGHSMGSQLSFYYLATCPDRCDMLVGIDVLKPLVRSERRIISDFEKYVDKMLLANERTGSEPPCYTRAELISLLVKGTNGSVTAETAPFLLERAVLPSMREPGKFFLRRDNRLKIFNYAITYHDLNLAMAKRIVAPHMYFKASNSPYYEDRKYYDETVTVLKENPHFELVNVDASHHVHLTEPTKICDDISRFLLKYRPS